MKTTAAIHVGLKQLGINEDDKRALYQRVARKDRLTDMTPSEQEKVVTELRRLGFKPDLKRSNGTRRLTGRFAKKLQALWISAWNLGVVRLRDDAALEAFVTRQTGLAAERFLHNAEDARRVVEALKAMIAREADVQWDAVKLDWLKEDGAKIAWAQWRKLHPEADLVSRRGFDADVMRIAGRIGPAQTMWALTPRQWQEVMNAYGERVRQLGKAVAA